MATQKQKKVSSKRRKLGKKLAKSLPRDEKGKFLPRGSKNLFRKKRVKKRKRTSVTKKKRRKRSTGTNARSRTTTLMSKRRKRVSGVRRIDEFANFITGDLFIASNVFGFQFDTTKIQTPLPRIKTSGNRATIMELLWVDFRIPTINANLDTATDSTFNMQLSTGQVPLSILPWSDPRVFAFIQFTRTLPEFPLFPDSTSVSTLQPWRYDMQAQTGEGFLLTAESFNLNVQTQGNNQGAIVGDIEIQMKLYYRFVDVPLEEYVGIVQSTQQ